MKPITRMSCVFFTVFFLVACTPVAGTRVINEAGTPPARENLQTPSTIPEKSQTPASDKMPQAGSPGTASVLVEWQRSGGIAGRCQQLTIYTDHSYQLSDCLEKTTLGTGELTAEQSAYLDDLAARYGSFRWKSNSPKQSADMFQDWYIFNGHGTETPPPQQMQEINNQLAAMASTLSSA
jgi:hypothetical protein